MGGRNKPPLLVLGCICALPGGPKPFNEARILASSMIAVCDLVRM